MVQGTGVRMAENASPEEKLFKIIQQEKGASPGGAEKPAPKKDADGMWIDGLKRAFLSWEEKIIAGIRGLGIKAAPPFSGRLPEIDLKTVNIALSIALVFIILFAAYYAAAKYPNISKVISAAVKAQSSLPPINRKVEELQPLTYYTEDARQRDIFNAVLKTVSAVSETIFLDGSKDAAGDLKLQGIAWTETPKVMIHSEKENKLYILKQGQAIGTTGIRVKTIMRNKVVLTAGDKDFEL